mmetsp:Transcript_14285/g.40644  ORF Transcript_14285/g.40644 Transcript_14285/m.40644 type:complete len:228 (+) Transcript_14285:807-1490(+)
MMSSPSRPGSNSTGVGVRIVFPCGDMPCFSFALAGTPTGAAAFFPEVSEGTGGFFDDAASFSSDFPPPAFFAGGLGVEASDGGSRTSSLLPLPLPLIFDRRLALAFTWSLYLSSVDFLLLVAATPAATAAAAPAPTAAATVAFEDAFLPAGSASALPSVPFLEAAVVLLAFSVFSERLDSWDALARETSSLVLRDVLTEDFDLVLRTLDAEDAALAFSPDDFLDADF